MSENAKVLTEKVSSRRFSKILGVGAAELLDYIGPQAGPLIPAEVQPGYFNTWNKDPHTCTQSCFKTLEGWKMAVQGKRLCKAGNYRAGVLLFEAALQAGTTNKPTLIAMYSLIGVAYFNLEEYEKAWYCHRLELTIANATKDLPALGRSIGNLGNVMKMKGDFSEAIKFFEVELDLSRRLKNNVMEARALYNLSKAYRALAKHNQKELGDLHMENSESLN